MAVKTIAQELQETKKQLRRMTPAQRQLWLQFNEHIRGAMLAIGELFEIEQARKDFGLRRVTFMKARSKRELINAALKTKAHARSRRNK